MFHCKDTDLIVVEREEFVNMFREDSKTDRILKYLDLNTKTFAKRTEKAKSPNRSETAPPEQLYKNNYETAPKLIYCKIEGYIRMLKVWWSQLHPISDMVHISRIGDFLAEKSLVSNKHEGIRIIKEVSYSNSISYHEFEKVFLKAIFKASLMNLAAGLNNGELGEADASLRLKLSSYQRFLMINGNNPDFEFKLGRNTLQAINKYQSAQPDISRNRVVKEIKEAVANHEEKHKDRIKAYLYRIKKHAKEFVNERGEVITSFKNTWDIRDIVNSKYSKNISTVLDEEQTFDEDKYLNDLLRNKKNKLESVPIARKIKTFRENYMYEKYQRTVAMTRGKKK